MWLSSTITISGQTEVTRTFREIVEGGVSAALSPFKSEKIETEVSRLDLKNWNKFWRTAAESWCHMQQPLDRLVGQPFRIWLTVQGIYRVCRKSQYDTSNGHNSCETVDSSTDDEGQYCPAGSEVKILDHTRKTDSRGMMLTSFFSELTVILNGNSNWKYEILEVTSIWPSARWTYWMGYLQR